VDGLLSLLSKQDLSKGRSQVTAQTSVIEATINLKTGIVACSRLDLLIAGKISKLLHSLQIGTSNAMN
jgi:hypothetical protein